MIELLINDVVILIIFLVSVFVLERKTLIGTGDVHIELARQRNRADRNKRILDCVDTILLKRREGHSFSEQLLKKDVKTIAIYGCGYVGKALCDTIVEEKQVEVKYLIDKRAGQKVAAVPVLSLEDEWEPVDAIIVTVLGSSPEIKATALKDVECEIISIEDYLEAL